MRARVAMAIGQLVPGEGGAELQALRLAAALRRRGHEIEIITSRPRGYPALEILEGVPVRRLFAFGNRRGLWRLGIYSAAGLLGQTLVSERRRFDLVHVHQLLHTACAVMAARPLHRLPVLVKIATAGRYGDLHQMRVGDTHFVGSRQLLPMALRADRFVAISDEIGDELREAGVAPERIARIPNGVILPPPPSSPERRAARASLGAQEGDEVVVYVGRCDAQKGPDLLLAAWEVLRRRPRCHLFVLGRGFPGDPRFCAAAAASARIHVLGRVSDVPRYLRAADALLHPSRGEGLSNSLLEALAHGVPCVASGLLANVELLGGGAGVLTPPGDGAAAGRLCAELLDDPERRRALALAGRRRAEDYGLDGVAARYEALYGELLGWSKGREPEAPRPGLTPGPGAEPRA